MNTIAGSPGATGKSESLPPRVTDISFSMVPVDSLLMPVELFDEKTPALPDSDFDAALPVIAAKSDMPGKYTIVDGCKRVKRFRETHRLECACGILSEPVDQKTLGLLRIRYNQKRPLYIRESVCFLNWLEKNYTGKVFEDLAETLGFSPSHRHELRPLLACGDMVINAVEQGGLALKAVADLCLLVKTDQAAFLGTFRDVLLSQQTQREFLEWLPEIAFERKTTVAEILRSENIQKTMSDTTLNSPQKIEAIRNLLFSEKFPGYNEVLKKWKKLATTTANTVLANEPSSKVAFIPNPAFEKNNLELRISIAHAKAAKELFTRLSEIPQDTWSRLIYPVIEEI